MRPRKRNCGAIGSTMLEKIYHAENQSFMLLFVASNHLPPGYELKIIHPKMVLVNY